MTALFARGMLDASVESVKNGRKLLCDVCEREKFFVEFATALLAVPDEAVFLARESLALDDQTDRVGWSLRRMRRVAREKKNLAFVYLDVNRLAVVDYLEDDVALDLVEELFALIDVVVGTRVRSTDNHYDELTIFPDALVADRWLQEMPVFIDPLFEINRAQSSHIKVLSAYTNFTQVRKRTCNSQFAGSSHDMVAKPII